MRRRAPARRLAARARALAAAVIGALAIVACGSSSPATPPLPVRHGPELQSILEPGNLLMSQPMATLDQLRALGVQRVRVDVIWNQIAPDPLSPRAPANFQAANPAAYPASGWASYDRVFSDARALGIGIYATVTGPAPVWAEAPGEPRGGFVGVWKPNAADFGAFVRAVGRRYSGSYVPPGGGAPLPRIDLWSIWNEPNNGFDLAPQAVHHNTVTVSPRVYRALLDAAWAALRATGHGQDTILIGETAPRGEVTFGRPGNFSVMEPLVFIRALYCLDGSFAPLAGALARASGCPVGAGAKARFRAENPALFDASGFADHPYPQGSAPPDEPTTGVPGDSGYADFASLGRLESTLDRALAAYGVRRSLPIWSSEFGYHTNPPEQYEPSPQLAAAYLNWSEYLSWRNPRLRSYDQYLLRDAVGDRFATGLELANGTPLATFYAFRMPLYLPSTVQRGDSPLLVWGCVRPVRYVAGRQLAALQFAAGRAGPFRTIRRVAIGDRAGYFVVYQRFPSSGRVRVAWSYPSGQRIYSRIVSVRVG
jgi:hypothetical protein